MLENLLLQITLKLQGDTVQAIRRHMGYTKYRRN